MKRSYSSPIEAAKRMKTSVPAASPRTSVVRGTLQNQRSPITPNATQAARAPTSKSASRIHLLPSGSPISGSRAGTRPTVPPSRRPVGSAASSATRPLASVRPAAPVVVNRVSSLRPQLQRSASYSPAVRQTQSFPGYRPSPQVAPYRQVIGGAQYNSSGMRPPGLGAMMPERRMPLIIPTEKAVLGTVMPDGRWTCGKCGRANKELRKVCGRRQCGGIAPLNLGQVVIDCANVGCRYGECHKITLPGRPDAERHRKFHWQGVREALKHYQALGLVVSLITKENWPAPIPPDLAAHACTVPRVDGDKENDDYFVLKLAYQKNCFYVTNDNFRNWKEEVEDEVMAIWFLATKRHLHVSYVFSNQGEFIPRRDAIIDWADCDDPVAGPLAVPKEREPIPSDGEVSLGETDDKGYQTADELRVLLGRSRGEDSDFRTGSPTVEPDTDSDFAADVGDLGFDGEADDTEDDELLIDGQEDVEEPEELELDGDIDDGLENLARTGGDAEVCSQELELDDDLEMDDVCEGELELETDAQVIDLTMDELELDADEDPTTAASTPVAAPKQRRSVGGFYERRPWS